MRTLLIALIFVFTPLVASADFNPTPSGRAEVALQLTRAAISELSGQTKNFELASSHTQQAKQLLTAQLSQESDKALKRILRGATLHLLLALNNIHAHDALMAIKNLQASADATLIYLAGGEELGLCCTRDNCKGCTLQRVTKDTCKEAGIYKTFRKHRESNPYPNEPEEGQCETL